jgi:hypothetical protein
MLGNTSIISLLFPFKEGMKAEKEKWKEEENERRKRRIR